jgi:L-seryl-tRNA(Ser) seleniumtransferase
VNRRLRGLPSVQELASRLDDVPRPLAVESARAAIARRRELLLASGPGAQPLPSGAASGAAAPSSPAEEPPPPSDAELEADARALAGSAGRTSLRPVLNATGVIVHTNLGRTPLAQAAVDAAAAVARGYSTLEYALDTGARGSRQEHVEGLVRELTGAEAALVVNNCAAATLLAATATAAGREIVVSRGQLVEIGGSFRIPDVVEASGARLIEVGTTNRTRLADYERAIGPETGAILRVHPSNFRTVGFVEEVEIEDLCELGRRAGVPVLDDAGSGALLDEIVALGDEPDVRRSVAAGCALVCFSGDKLLGGPQAGLMAGSAAALERCRRHPLGRALRIDKLSLAALEATLHLMRDPEKAARELPLLRMVHAREEELGARAERMRTPLVAAGINARVDRSTARVGGGALPLLELEGPACFVAPPDGAADELAAHLRLADPPVIGRIGEGELVLDPRTLDGEDADVVAGAVVSAVRGG